MLHRMVRVLVAGPREYFEQAVDVLYRTGTIHLEDTMFHAGAASAGIRRVLVPSSGEIASILLSIDGLLTRLPKPDTQVPDRLTKCRDEWCGDEIISRARSLVEEIGPEVAEIAEHITTYELSIATMSRYRKVILRIRPVESLIPVLDGFEVTVLLVQRQFADVIELIRETLKEVTEDRSEVLATDLDDETIAAVTIFPRENEARIHSFLFARNVNELRFPPELEGIPFDSALERINAREKEEREKIGQLQERLRVLGQEKYHDLVCARRCLTELQDERAVFSRFAETDYTFLIQGWIPEKRMDATQEALTAAFGNRVVITPLTCSPADEEDAPVLTNNPRLIRPFEVFFTLSGMPSYREIDPTPFFAVFFPLFFGVMVGDVGYGLVILAMTFMIRRTYGPRFPWLADLMDILMISSIPAIFFGVLYGEFFGNLGEELGFLHPVTIFGVTWNRLEVMIPLLIGAIALGFIHITLGLSLGIVNAFRDQDLHHIAERAGILMMIWGIWTAVLGAGHILPDPALTIGGVMLFIGVPTVVIGGGIRGATEILGTVGNVLSYARIMAIGLASVVLAMVANTLGQSAGTLVLAVLIAIPLHVLNIILAMFSPTIHAMRLHIVEFFSKFYVGGGVRYSPFGARAGKEKPPGRENGANGAKETGPGDTAIAE